MAIRGRRGAGPVHTDRTKEGAEVVSRGWDPTRSDIPRGPRPGGRQRAGQGAPGARRPEQRGQPARGDGHRRGAHEQEQAGPADARRAARGRRRGGGFDGDARADQDDRQVPAPAVARLARPGAYAARGRGDRGEPRPQGDGRRHDPLRAVRPGVPQRRRVRGHARGPGAEVGGSRARTAAPAPDTTTSSRRGRVRSPVKGATGAVASWRPRAPARTMYLVDRRGRERRERIWPARCS